MTLEKEKTLSKEDQLDLLRTMIKDLKTDTFQISVEIKKIREENHIQLKEENKNDSGNILIDRCIYYVYTNEIEGRNKGSL